jgi:hypothetical protein
VFKLLFVSKILSCYTVG